MGNRSLVCSGRLVRVSNADTQIPQQPILDFVNPPMDCQRLPPLPGIVDDGGLANIEDLFDDVKLTETVPTLVLFTEGGESRFMLLVHISNVPQPVIDQAEPVIPKGGANTPASIMATHNDVLDLQYIDRKLHRGQAVQVCVNHQVGNIAVNEQLPRQETDNLVCRHAAIGTTNPQIAGRLLVRQLPKEIRIVSPDVLGPSPVLFKEMAQDPHLPFRSSLASRPNGPGAKLQARLSLPGPLSIVGDWRQSLAAALAASATS